MKNKKRIISLVLCIAIILPCIAALVISLRTAASTHTHTYSSEYSVNETAHWKECNNEECEVISEYGLHSFDEGVTSDGYTTYTCTECGYEKKTLTGLKAIFDTDDNVSVIIYNTQDVTGDGTKTNTAYAKSGEDGSLVVDGSGQINFKVEVTEGYVIDTITINGEYNKIKNDPEGDGSTDYYRITKVASDLEIIITTREEVIINGYTVTFEADEDVTITVYDTQDITGEGVVTNTAYAKTKTGLISKTGEEQVNFVITLPEGYEIESVEVTSGTYKNIKSDPEASGDTNYYRITKITSDLVVKITKKPA